MGRAKLNGQSGGAKINGIINDYIVQSGENISTGDFVEFVKNISQGTKQALNSASTASTSAVAINSTQVLVVYKDTSSYGVAQVLTISGITITAGTKYIFNSGSSTNYVTVAMLTSTTAIVAYDGGGYGGARVLTISGAAITIGPENVFRSGCNCLFNSLAILTSTRVIIAFRNDGAGSYGSAYLLTISGTTITYTGGVNFRGAWCGYISAVVLSTTSVLVAYRNETSYAGESIVLTVSGSTITPGTYLVFCANAAYTSAVAISSTSALITYVDNGGNARAIIVTINGTTITNGVSVYFGGLTNTYTNVILLSKTSVLLLYNNATLPAGTAIFAKIVGNSILLGTPYVFNGVNIQSLVGVILPSTSLCPILYTDATIASTFYVYEQVLSLPTSIKKSLNIATINGVAKSSGAAGSTIKVNTLAD